MRPQFCFPLILAAALAVSTGAIAQTTPTPNTVAPNSVGGLTETEQKRMDALYGPGWQYRTAVPPRGSLSNDPPAADLSQLDARIKSDDAVMARMRNAAMLRENANLSAIRPALPYKFERRKWPRITRRLPDFGGLTRAIRERF